MRYYTSLFSAVWEAAVKTANGSLYLTLNDLDCLLTKNVI